MQVILGALFGALAARVVDGSVKRGLRGGTPLNPHAQPRPWR